MLPPTRHVLPSELSLEQLRLPSLSGTSID